jgi:hypothetical protein
MLNRYLVIVFVMLFSVSVSHAYEPSKQEKANADYGAYPKNYKNIVKNYMQGVLKDPESARYKVLSSPQKFYMVAGTIEELVYCYTTAFSINAKNSYGGYTGEKIYFFQIRNGEIIDVHYPR